MTLTHHVYSPIPLTISERTWQRLSAADREAYKAAKEAGDWTADRRANDERQLKEMAGLGAHIAKPGQRAVARRGAAGHRAGRVSNTRTERVHISLLEEADDTRLLQSSHLVHFRLL